MTAATRAYSGRHRMNFGLSWLAVRRAPTSRTTGGVGLTAIIEGVAQAVIAVDTLAPTGAKEEEMAPAVAAAEMMKSPTAAPQGRGGSRGDGHTRSSETVGKGSHGKGGHGLSSSDGRRGHRGYSHRGAYGGDGSSSSEERGKRAAIPEFTVVSGKRQVAPFLA